MPRTSDAAWAAVIAAHGHVQGKTLHMRAETLAQILRERGDCAGAVPRHMLIGRRLYGIRVTLDPLMKFGEVILK